MGHRETVVALSLAVSSVAGSARAQERVLGEASAEAKTEYRDFVVRYARGDRAPAVAGLAHFSIIVLNQITRAIEDAAWAAQLVIGERCNDDARANGIDACPTLAPSHGFCHHP